MHPNAYNFGLQIFGCVVRYPQQGINLNPWMWYAPQCDYLRYQNSKRPITKWEYQNSFINIIIHFGWYVFCPLTIRLLAISLTAVHCLTFHIALFYYLKFNLITSGFYFEIIHKMYIVQTYPKLVFFNVQLQETRIYGVIKNIFLYFPTFQ